MDLGDSSPDGRSSLAVPLAEQFARLFGEFLGLAEVLFAGHRCSSCLVR